MKTFFLLILFFLRTVEAIVFKPKRVEGISIMNGAIEVGPLSNNTSIDIALYTDLKFKATVRAFAGARLASAKFIIDGVVINTDSAPPFESGTWVPTVGTHTIQVNASRRGKSKGKKLGSKKYTFIITNSKAKTPAPFKAPPVPIATPVAPKAPASVPVTILNPKAPESTNAPMTQMTPTKAPVLVPAPAPTTATPPVNSPVTSPFAVPVAGPDASPVTVPLASPVASPVTVPLASPVASPVAGPVASPVATPVIVPVASPVSVPLASPVASPVAGPVASPVATPVTVPIASPVSVPLNSPVAAPISVPLASPVATPVSVPDTSPVASPVTVPLASPVASPVAGPVAPIETFPFRISAGDQVVVDGITYFADSPYVTGGTIRTVGPSVDESNLNALTRKGRFETSLSDKIQYKIPLRDGNYQVVLIFAEFDFSAVGERVFKVIFDGTVYGTNNGNDGIDIYGITLMQYKTYRTGFSHASDGGTLDIAFEADKGFPMICGIVICDNSCKL